MARSACNAPHHSREGKQNARREQVSYEYHHRLTHEYRRSMIRGVSRCPSDWYRKWRWRHRKFPCSGTPGASANQMAPFRSRFREPEKSRSFPLVSRSFGRHQTIIISSGRCKEGRSVVAQTTHTAHSTRVDPFVSTRPTQSARLSSLASRKHPHVVTSAPRAISITMSFAASCSAAPTFGGRALVVSRPATRGVTSARAAASQVRPTDRSSTD